MGNAQTSHRGGAVVLMSDDGRLQEYRCRRRRRRPVLASDVARDNPGRFVCHPGHLRVGHRVPGLPPHQELDAGLRYLLLPLDMLHSVLTQDEMAVLAAAAAKAEGQRSRACRRVVDVDARVATEKVGPDEVEETAGGKGSVAAGEGHEWEPVVTGRTWRPALDTIDEDRRCFIDG